MTDIEEKALATAKVALEAAGFTVDVEDGDGGGPSLWPLASREHVTLPGVYVDPDGLVSVYVGSKLLRFEADNALEAFRLCCADWIQKCEDRLDTLREAMGRGAGALSEGR